MANWVVRNRDMTQLSIPLGAEVSLSCSHRKPDRASVAGQLWLDTFLRTKVGPTCCAPPQFVFRLGAINATGQVWLSDFVASEKTIPYSARACLAKYPLSYSVDSAMQGHHYTPTNRRHLNNGQYSLYHWDDLVSPSNLQLKKSKSSLITRVFSCSLSIVDGNCCIDIIVVFLRGVDRLCSGLGQGTAAANDVIALNPTQPHPNIGTFRTSMDGKRLT
ncbi:hypothetical protein EMPG_14638 [Blastomyces silverae]|uniref:Uncharacterized protein n=1 Tax=Blastomyces silverae TaxID=2060906 RepID=A0A0H1BFY9_9EURO|nr:hypothetical protein EMPG_14638 [Blastomyces silverae]